MHKILPLIAGRVLHGLQEQINYFNSKIFFSKREVVALSPPINFHMAL